MKRIKITQGTYGHRDGGKGALRPKTVNDAPFEVADDEAKRLVAMKVAVLAEPSSDITLDEDTALADAMLRFVNAAEDKEKAFRQIYLFMENLALLVGSELPDFSAALAAEDVDGEQAGDNPAEDENAAEGKETAVDYSEEDTAEAEVIDVVYEVPDYNVEMTVAELKEIMEQCGLTYKVGMSRAKMVAALDAYCATAEDAEDLPELQTEEPVT